MEQEQVTQGNRKLNMPRPWLVALLGTYHEQAILLILLISLIPIGVNIVAKDRLHDIVELSLVVFSLFLIIGGARHYVLAPFTRFLKRYVVGSFHVIYFRSFREDRAYEARDMIAPILGCIGRLTTIHNKTYIQGLTRAEGHDHSEDLWFAWLELGEILSDGLKAIKCEGDTWRPEVRRRLATVDLVVIDVTVCSDNVEWERNQAREFLPADRVIAIRATGSKPTADVECIEYELSPKGRKKFRRALIRKLTAIKSVECKVTSP